MALSNEKKVAAIVFDSDGDILQRRVKNGPSKLALVDVVHTSTRLTANDCARIRILNCTPGTVLPLAGPDRTAAFQAGHPLLCDPIPPTFPSAGRTGADICAAPPRGPAQGGSGAGRPKDAFALSASKSQTVGFCNVIEGDVYSGPFGGGNTQPKPYECSDTPTPPRGGNGIDPRKNADTLV